MARDYSKIKAGYLPLLHRHWKNVRSLIAADSGARTLDPFAGMDDPENGGHFHSWLSQEVGMEAFANELSAERAETLETLYDIHHLVVGPAERLQIPLNSMSFLYANPPYDRGLELRLLDETWKFLQPGGVFMWVVYKSHMTPDAIAFFASRVEEIRVMGLPGKHLGEYDQIVVIGTKSAGKYVDMDRKKRLLVEIADMCDNMPLLDSELAEPLFVVPAAKQIDQWYFTTLKIDRTKALRLLTEGEDALSLRTFQRHLVPPPVFTRQRSVHPPRPGHMALVLGSGIIDGAVFETKEYGKVLMCATKHRVDTVISSHTEQTDGGSVTRRTVREHTKVTVTLVKSDGTIIELSGDSLVLPFVAENAEVLSKLIHEAFDPIYQFDFGDYRKEINAVRLGNEGQYQLYLAQKHMIAAVLEGFKHLFGILISAEMGTGKTSQGGSIAYVGAASSLAKNLNERGDVTVIVAPPHLMPKWKEEIGWQGRGYIKQVNNMKDLRAALNKIATLPRTTPKFIIVKRDLTKLGAGFEASVKWKTGDWLRDDDHKIVMPATRTRIATCPTCGSDCVGKDNTMINFAGGHYFDDAKRSCPNCHAPLWQEKRSEKSEGTNENHRMRLDQAVKRYLKDRLRLFIWDEVHEAANPETGNGEAFARIGSISRRVLALTGTPMNGRAQSLYNLAYVLDPKTREQFPRGGSARMAKKVRGSKEAQAINTDFTATAANMFEESRSRWTDIMGVRERVETETEETDVQTGRMTGTTTKKKAGSVEAPGVTPTCIGHFMPFTAFMSLKDLDKWLPKFSEITESVLMDEKVAETYRDVYNKVQDFIADNRWEKGMGKEIASIRSRFMEWSMGWPNAPFRDVQFFTKGNSAIDGKPRLIAEAKALPESFITLKEKRLIEHVTTELAEGRKCIIYVRQSKSNDIQPRIANLLKAYVPEANPYILYSKIEPERRGDVIKNKVNEGCNVLISHPGLVKTGLDLIQFATIIVYEMIFELSTLMQATRRCYRLNQTQPECKVLYLYYSGSENEALGWMITTAEASAVKLMSLKQRSIKMLLGQMGMTGFDALSGGDEAMNLENQLVEALAGVGKGTDLVEETAAMQAVDRSDAKFWNANPWLEEMDSMAVATIEAEMVIAQAEADVMPAPVLESLMGALEIIDRVLARMRPVVESKRVALPPSMGSNKPFQARLML